MGLSIGILGGSFDPVHNGHLAITQRVMEERHLDKTLLIPAAIPPHKTTRLLTAPHHRLNMLRLATQNLPGLEPRDIEIRRGGISYTIDTVRSLLAELPPGTEINLIVGADMAADLPNWRNVRDLLTLCRIIPVNRAGFANDYFNVLESLLDPKIVADMRNRQVTIPPIDISSTLIRQLVKEGKNISGLTPDAVIDYIYSNRLYQD